MCGLGKFCSQFALFTEKFTQSTKILRDRRSHRSRQIWTLAFRFWPTRLYHKKRLESNSLSKKTCFTNFVPLLGKLKLISSHRDNAFNLCPWFGQSRISLDNVILSLDNVMTFLISSPILDNVAWFRLSTPDYGQFCTFSYISQNIMDNSVPFVEIQNISVLRHLLWSWEWWTRNEKQNWKCSIKILIYHYLAGYIIVVGANPVGRGKAESGKERVRGEDEAGEDGEE